MSPMLLSLVVGWAVVTVIVVAVSIIAIRGQRHGAEREEVLVPWKQSNSEVSASKENELAVAAASPLFAPVKSEVKGTTDSEVVVTTEMETVQEHDSEISYGYFVAPETRFIRTLKKAISQDLCIWRNLTHEDLAHSENVVSIEKDASKEKRTGLEHAPLLYSLHSKESFKPICLIHIVKKKSLSEKFVGRKAIDAVQKLAEADELPLIRIDEEHQYSKGDIQELLAFHLPGRYLSAREHHHVSHDKGAEKICPRCSSTMSKKIASRGKYAGTRFWACNSYPDCRQVEVIQREYAEEAQSS